MESETQSSVPISMTLKPCKDCGIPTTLRQCELCGKDLEVSNWSRHYKLCKQKFSNKAINSFSCELCGKAFTVKFSLKRHANSCQTLSVKKSKLPCGFDGCSVVCNSKVDLIDHVILKHETSEIHSVMYQEFNSFLEFLSWKRTEEKRTHSYFRKKSGSLKNATYYYCHKDHSAKSHKKNVELNCIKNSVGKIKSGLLCFASIKTVLCSDVVKVWYYSTHNHKTYDTKIKHHPDLSSKCSSSLEEEIITVVLSPDDSDEHTGVKVEPGQ